jgi:hypothetical protein
MGYKLLARTGCLTTSALPIQSLLGKLDLESPVLLGGKRMGSGADLTPMHCPRPSGKGGGNREEDAFQHLELFVLSSVGLTVL